MKNLRKNTGITLIALVITIIVLLILAGISIATLTGENGVLSKANTAKKQSEIEDAKEQAKLDITAWTADRLEKGESTTLDDSIIQEILTDKSYVKDQPGAISFKTAKSGFEILYSELYQKKVSFKIVYPKREYDSEDFSGTYEVNDGTTWAVFFSTNNPEYNDYYAGTVKSWWYRDLDSSIWLWDYMIGPSCISISMLQLINSETKEPLYKDDTITARYLFSRFEKW